MASPVADAGPSVGIPGRKLTTIDLVGGIYCNICNLTFGNKKEYDSHYLMHETGSKEITYTCVACHVTSTSYPSFRGHCYTNHVIKDRFKCQYCNKTLSKLTALKEHIDAIHTFKCNSPSCDKQFPSKKELYLHQILHKSDVNKPPYQCQICTLEIDSIVSCEDHIDKHCMFSYSCPICNENITKEDASNHLTKHFGNTELTDEESKDSEMIEIPEDSSINIVGGILCCYCNNLFKNRTEIDTHFAEEHPVQTIVYSCNICGKQYEKYSMFGDHCYYHYSKNKFVCESCDKTFPRLSLLVIHAEAHGGQGARGTEARFPCGRCPRSFQTARRLRDHERDAHHVHTLACPEPGCPHVFETPKDLILHRKHHETALGTWCRQCGLQFPTLASAEKHIDVHKKKLFSCPVCERQYGEKYLLMKHIPQHFETVFHMCKVCGKIFNAKNRLSEHVKIHSSVKSYECKFCGKGFLKPYQLSQHLNVHTGARPYQCVACPKTFASLPNWQKHVRRMHNIDPKIKKKTDETNNQKSYEVLLKNEPKIENFELDENTQDVKKTYDFCVNESMIELDSIDTKLVAIEARSFEYEVDVKSMSADSDSIDDFTPILPDDANEFVSEMLGSGELVTLPVSPATVPREYGPDFTLGATLSEEDELPHINPALLSLPPSQPWEPIITKLYSGYYADRDDRYSIINTDIF